MNLRVVSWLIAHRDVLMKIVAAVQKFDMDSSYLDKWTIIDEIARLLIPVIDDEVRTASTEPDGDVQIYAAQIMDLGIDWKTFIDIVLPIIMAILQVLTKKKEE